MRFNRLIQITRRVMLFISVLKTNSKIVECFGADSERVTRGTMRESISKNPDRFV